MKLLNSVTQGNYVPPPPPPPFIIGSEGPFIIFHYRKGQRETLVSLY